MSDIRDEAYTEACAEIDRLRIKVAQLQEEIKLLCDALEGIMDDDGHYPLDAPLRKLVTSLRLRR